MYDVVPGALQRLREADIIGLAGLTVASLGQEYCRVGVVHSTQRSGARLAGVVDVSDMALREAAIPTNGVKRTTYVDRGTTPGRYSVEVELQNPAAWVATCTCAEQSSFCSHAAALLYQWVAQPATFVSHPASASIASPIKAADGDLPRRNFSRQTRDFQDSEPAAALAELLGQTGLGELRTMAREYEIAATNLSKQQLLEAIVAAVQQPEAVRRMVGTLEKPQRQLLAALTLAGGSLNDDDLRGMFERFSLGSPNQLQAMLLALQNKALLIRTSLNSSLQPRSGLSGSALDVSWRVPAEVRAALHVTLPITPFDIEASSDGDAAAPRVQRVEPYRLLADLLLVARALDGSPVEREEKKNGRAGTPGTWLPTRGAAQRTLSGGQVTRQGHPGYETNAPAPQAADGSVPVPAPAAMPALSLLEALQSVVPRSPSFLRFAIRLLRMAEILYIDDNAPERVIAGMPLAGTLRVLPNAARLLLGPTSAEVAHELFTHWLKQSTYDELFGLQEEGMRLRCRATPLNQPALRPGELEIENREARQALLALLAQAPAQRWINFAAFARFVFRLNPTFLQKRQRLFSSPHWWIEQEEGRPLQPMQVNDWLRAEGRYLAQLIQGPLHWWGITDVATSPDGNLLAFRLTHLAGVLLNGMAPEPLVPTTSSMIDVSQDGHLLIPCASANWELIELIEHFAEVKGVHTGQLCYRLTPQSLGEALSRGESPAALLEQLREVPHWGALNRGGHDKSAPYYGPSANNRPLTHMLAQLERRIANYGRVRLYTDVSLLEAADTLVMRELSAITSLDEQVVQSIHPTLLIVKKQGVERLIDELKRRGQVPLLHDSAPGRPVNDGVLDKSAPYSAQGALSGEQVTPGGREVRGTSYPAEE